MRVFRWLTLLLACSGAHAASTELYGPCWDNSYWVGDSASVCPPELLEPTGGADVSATTSGVTVNTSKAGGTLYAYAKATSTPGTCPADPTYSQLISGSGAAASGTDASVTVGLNQINLTGLSAGTEYCVWFLHVDDKGRPSANNANIAQYIAESVPWETLAGAPSGDDLETYNALFVGSGGSDSNSCTSHATRCATLAGALAKNNTAGQDIYLLAGYSESSGGTQHTIDFAGSSADPVIIGCYYRDSANGNQATSCDQGSGANAQTKPVLYGSLTSTCRTNNNCIFTGNIYTAKLAVTRSWVTVQDIRIEGVLGRAFTVNGTGTGGITNIYFKRLEAQYVGDAATMMEKSVSRLMVRDSEFSDIGWCWQQEERSGGTYDCIYNAPAAVSAQYATHVLYENNEVYRSYAEAFGAYFGSTYIIMRGNRAGELHSYPYYIGGEYAVIEHNISWMGPRNSPSWAANNTRITGVGSGAAILENGRFSNNTDTPVRGIVMRNNILIGRGDCLSTGMNSTGIAQGYDVEGYFYGNTCIGFYNRGVDAVYGGVSDSNVVATEFGSNIFWSDTETDAAAICSATAKAVSDYNMWSYNPSDSDCDGAADIIGNPTFATGLTLAQFRDLVYATQPDVDDVRLTGASNGVGDGNPALETEVVLNDADWPMFSEMATPFAPVAANWEKKLYYDFEGTARDATTPDMGAVEYTP